MTVMLAWIFLGVGYAWATTFETVEYRCPSCGRSVEAEQAMSTSTFGSDTDLMPLSLGAPAFPAAAITCTGCLYSGHSSDFGKTVALTQAQKDAIRDKVRPMLPLKKGAASGDVPAFVRFDLMAQVYQIRGMSEFEIGNAFLLASWAGKLDFPGQSIFAADHEHRLQERSGKIEKDLPPIDLAKVGMRDYSLKRAEQFLTAANTNTGEAQLACLWMAMRAYWQYGEINKVQEISRRCGESLGPDTAGKLEQVLRDAAARQKMFQVNAATHFEAAAKVAKTKKAEPAQAVEGEEDGSPPPAGVLYYLAGELHRRGGDPDKARQLFRIARGCELPEGYGDLLTTQEQLLPATRPSK